MPRELRLDFYWRMNYYDTGADMTTLLATRLAHAAIDFLSHAKKPVPLQDELTHARSDAPLQKEE